MRLKAALILMAAMAVGCQSSPGPVLQGQAVLPGGEDSAAFLDRMSSQRRVTQNDAMRGVLLLIDNDKDDNADFAHRAEALRKHHILPEEWTLDASATVTKGQLAYMIYQACHVEGGVTLTLTGPTQRYCLRELQYQQFMTNGTMFDKVTGMEFIAVLQRAQGYLEKGEVPEIHATHAGAPGGGL